MIYYMLSKVIFIQIGVEVFWSGMRGYEVVHSAEANDRTYL